MDNGYPQILTPEALKLYIMQQGVRRELAPFEIRVRPGLPARLARSSLALTRTLRPCCQRRAQESRNATMQVTGAVSWRREGLRYKKNEVYLDIIESINVLMTSKGTRAAHGLGWQARRLWAAAHAHARDDAFSCAGVVLRSDVSGKVQMKCFLSVRAPAQRLLLKRTRACSRVPTCAAQGMPELKLGLNDRLSAAGGDAGGADGGDAGPSSAGGYSGGGSRCAGAPAPGAAVADCRADTAPFPSARAANPSRWTTSPSTSA
jgi:hypothetical protein